MGSYVHQMYIPCSDFKTLNLFLVGMCIFSVGHYENVSIDSGINILNMYRINFNYLMTFVTFLYRMYRLNDV